MGRGQGACVLGPQPGLTPEAYRRLIGAGTGARPARPEPEGHSGWAAAESKPSAVRDESPSAPLAEACPVTTQHRGRIGGDGGFRSRKEPGSRQPSVSGEHQGPEAACGSADLGPPDSLLKLAPVRGGHLGTRFPAAPSLNDALVSLIPSRSCP